MLGLKALREYVHFGSLEGADYLIDALSKLDSFVLLLACKPTSLQFFEAPREPPPKDEWQHAERFSSATTRFVYWHIALDHVSPSVPFDLDLEASWQRPAGAEVFRQSAAHRIEPGWTNSYCCRSYGADHPGSLPAGDYRVELRLWDELLIGASFVLDAGR
jgi:hypothetical protein